MCGRCWRASRRRFGSSRSRRASTSGRILVALGHPPMLLGYPVYENEDAAATGANSLPILVTDFQHAHAIVNRVGLSVVRDEMTANSHTLFYLTRRTFSLKPRLHAPRRKASGLPASGIGDVP